MQPKKWEKSLHDHERVHLPNYKKNRNADRLHIHSEPFQESSCSSHVHRSAARAKIFRELVSLMTMMILILSRQHPYLSLQTKHDKFSCVAFSSP